MDKMAQASVIREKLAEAQNEMLRLTDELIYSICLKEFEPTAFDHGSCTVGLEDLSNGYMIARTKFVLTLGNGDQFKWPLLSVPYKLWPDSAKEAYGKLPMHLRPTVKEPIQ